jgi:uncharacterized protein (TIGR02246 family)
MRSAHDVIVEAYKVMENAFLRGDSHAVSEMYAEDAEWLVPGAPPIRGRAAIAEAWKGVIGSGGNRVRVDVREVQESGDLAFDVGAFTTTAPDGTTLNAGKYIVVWKREPGGAWKTYRDIFHWDIVPEGAS